ncbi:hypothetical protein DHW03_08350 [Pedobacter yonginense]|uniref:Uncharacterized protein n=2 Tax=Pedobacter yonginense TaxID=651869 RepID=A0A317EL58_9SPHI|nr:hypothetical protein DHW03_08350 [Pedobacter yonginense]
MALAYINLSSKQYFNFMCTSDFQRRIYHDTYREFQKKSKIYSLNATLHTFSDMVKANTRANSLHHKLQYCVMNTIEALENQMPTLQDEDGNAILFDFAELEIYASDLLNKAAHVVSLNYTSPKLVLHEIVDDLLILSYDNRSHVNETFIVKMKNDVMVNYQEQNALVLS